MRWRGTRRSDEGGIRRFSAGRLAGRFGAPAALALVAVTAFVVAGPDTLLGIDRQEAARITTASDEYPELAAFASKALTDTTKTWEAAFREDDAHYDDPATILFADTVESACDGAAVAEGPFYCVQNRRLYIDLAFLDALGQRIDGDAGFAQTYVVAHLVGHHVQALRGDTARVLEMQEGLTPPEADALAMRLDLQADCLAGAWARRTEGLRHVVSKADVEGGLSAVATLGAETVEGKAEEAVVPETFNHASAEQRAQWFRRGAQKGDLTECDTFAGDLN